MYFYKTPALVQKLFPRLVWHLHADKKVMYLSFDDGPTPEVTDWVLEELKKHHARATFFLVGKNVEKHPEYLEKYQRDGHAIGNHTYSHPDGWKVDPEEYHKDIEKAAALIPSGLFRPPYGRIRKKHISRISGKYKIIMWDVLSADFDPSADMNRSFDRITRHARDGSILVFHDSNKAAENCRELLPRILNYYGKKGFHFESLKPAL